MKFLKVSMIATLAFGFSVSCGKKKSDDAPTEAAEGSAINISGKLSLQGESVSLTGGSYSLATVKPEDLNVYCVTFALPPVAGSGTVDAQGAFALSLEGNNVSVGCFILKGTETLGNIVFKDPGSKSLSGDDKTADRLAFGGDTKLGSIVLDLSTGKAEVDVTKIETILKNTTAATAEAFDFTGSYEATSAGLTLPKGYTGICVRSEGNGDGGGKGEGKGDECGGPGEGEKLWLKRVAGKSADGKPRYAAMIWSSETAFNACGKKLGVSLADAKAHGIDFADAGIDAGPFVWTGDLEDGWKDKTNAKAKWSIQKFENGVEFKGFVGSKQFYTKYRSCPPNQPCNPETATPTVAAGFNFNANSNETGCRDPQGKPYLTRDGDFQNVTCSSETLPGGLSKNTCVKENVFKCVNIGGTFDLSGNPVVNAFVKYPDDFEVYAAQGALCSSIANENDSEDKRLAQLRCYADYFQQGDEDRSETSCRRDVRTNWSAKTVADFVLGNDGPVKARNQHVFELFDYSSATSGSLRAENREFRGVQIGNDFTDCEYRDGFSLTLKKDGTSNDLIVEMIQSETNVSPKPACVATFGAPKSGKFLFKLVKK